jgi:hypothetical protein
MVKKSFGPGKPYHAKDLSMGISKNVVRLEAVLT